MCGIVGFLRRIPATYADRDETIVRGMAACIKRRGPDHQAAFVDARTGLALGHLRLAILDLSPAGEQPMTSPGGRFTIVYNGEVYNHLALRRELEGVGAAPDWRGHSDTETLLAGFEAWGIEATVRRAIGMFAFAVWDRAERALFLGRDRIGEKPLYYGWQGQGEDRVFLFGSELASLKQHPAMVSQIDPNALAAYLRTGYVPAPQSIYCGVAKLTPGTIARVQPGSDTVAITPYWRAVDAFAQGQHTPFAGSPTEAVDVLESLLRDAVGQQMMADVPLGAFLSGGVDSSTIVALMQGMATRPVQTFTIGFDDAAFNEADHAKAVAAHLGTEHTELYVTPNQARDVIAKLPSIYSEPFADSSQIPTFLVSQLAKRAVTVSLSGDAGDELFAGYTRYDVTQRVWQKLSRIPRPMRAVAAKLLTTLSPMAWQRIADSASHIVPPLNRFSNVGNKIHKGAGVLASCDGDQLYRGITSYWLHPEAMVTGAVMPSARPYDALDMPSGLSNVERMMGLDLLTYLPDDILTKVDRAAMAVSLETRVPMLDHRVVEFAWTLPLAIKTYKGRSKWPLREVLYRHVPRELIERPKVGFSIPVGQWLRGPLRDWAEALLDPAKIDADGLLHSAPIRQAWQRHQTGRSDHQYELWSVLMFQAWREAL